MSDWKSLAPPGGFASIDAVSLHHRRHWEPNSENLLVTFFINHYPQAKLIIRFVTTDPTDLRPLSRSTCYLDSLDVYLEASSRVRNGV